MKNIRIALAATVFTLGAIATAPAIAWEPTKPINLVVGFSPGGGTDTIARTVASAAQEFFPVPLVIVNKSGAAGTLAAEYVAGAKPDGYTLLVAGGSESTSVGNHRPLKYDIRTDFTPILRINKYRIFLAVNAKSGITSIKELVEKSKAAPGKFSFSSGGNGSIYHSAMLVFNRETGTEMKHVPYKGGALGLAALVGGHVDVGVGAAAEVKPHVDSGKIVLIGHTSEVPSPAYPDVPTLQDAGYNVVLGNMKGFIGPAGIPDDVVQYLHDNFKKALDTETWKRLAAKQKIETAYANGPDFLKAMADMYTTVGKAVKAQ